MSEFTDVLEPVAPEAPRYLIGVRLREPLMPEDHLTTKGQGLGGGGGTGNRFQTGLFIGSQGHVGSKWHRHRPAPYKYGGSVHNNMSMTAIIYGTRLL